MASVFTQVREKLLPGHILYQDEVVFVMLSIAPHNPGHMLIVPVEECTDMTELTDLQLVRLMGVSQQCMVLTKELYGAPRAALLAAGLEVDHTHIHVFSLYTNADLDHDSVKIATPSELATEADRIKTYLTEHPIR